LPALLLPFAPSAIIAQCRAMDFREIHTLELAEDVDAVPRVETA
jgi:hypothetical protein